MVKKGFTVLELLIVIIIIGILATLGLTQYGRIVERSRGAEARDILGFIRKQATLFYLENNSLTPGGGIPDFGLANAGIGAGNDQIPGPNTADCKNSHYFAYMIISVSATVLTAMAARCGALGKGGTTPAAGKTLALRTTFPAGTDQWDPAGVGIPGGY